MSCFNEKSKTWSHLFVCFLNPHCYIFTMCDLTEIIATTFLFYTKKTPSSWSMISNYIRKIYFRLRFVEQQKWLAMCLSNDLC
jgi:hypothetical protein